MKSTLKTTGQNRTSYRDSGHKNDADEIDPTNRQTNINGKNVIDLKLMPLQSK